VGSRSCTATPQYAGPLDALCGPQARSTLAADPKGWTAGGGHSDARRARLSPGGCLQPPGGCLQPPDRLWPRPEGLEATAVALRRAEGWPPPSVGVEAGGGLEELHRHTAAVPSMI